MKNFKPESVRPLIPIVYRSPEEDVKALDEVAAELGHSRSSLSRFVMNNFLKSHKAKQLVKEF